MKRLLIALALFLIPALAQAQCNGVFPNNTVCGNITGANNTPRPTNPASFQGSAGGTNGQIQYNLSGALAGFTMTGDCTVSVPNIACTKVNGVAYGSSPAIDTVPLVVSANTTAYTAIPNCPASALRYSTSTHTFACAWLGVATIRPFTSQVNAAGSPWNATDPLGNAINCPVTTTQCVQETITAAQANAWAVEVNCTGTIPNQSQPAILTTTSILTIPPMFMGNVRFIGGCPIQSTVSPIFFVDSQDSSTIYLQVRPNSSASNFVSLLVKPTSSTTATSLGVVNSTIYIESAAGAGSGAGCVYDTTNAGIIGNTFTCQDSNAGANGISVNVTNIFEENKIYSQYAHTHTSAAIIAGTTSPGFCRKNNWFVSRIAPNGATYGIETGCQDDVWHGPSVSNEEGAVSIGIALTSSASGNVFLGANVLNATTGLQFAGSSARNTFIGGTVVGATTAKSDSGIYNRVINMAGVSDAGPTANLVACSATTEGSSVGVTDANANTWGGGFTGGGTNHINAYCNGTLWTVMGK